VSTLPFEETWQVEAVARPANKTRRAGRRLTGDSLFHRGPRQGGCIMPIRPSQSSWKRVLIAPPRQNPSRSALPSA